MAAPVPVAGAQEPGVVYEPGSPSYKEYAIPLEEARRDAGGGIPNSIESRAFGIGLSRGSGPPPGSGTRRGGRGGSADDTGRGGEGGAGQAGAGGQSEKSGSRARSDRLAGAEAAGAPSLWRLGPLLIVLLPALLVGLLLARRDGAQPAT